MLKDSCSAPGLTPYHEALASLLAKVETTTQVIDVTIENACGHILAKTIQSQIAIPSADNSAMDGYALKAADLQDGKELKQVAKIFAGHPYADEIKSGQCARIMTGGQIPKGCDAVVMQENTQVDGDRVTFLKAPHVGENVRPAGEDIAVGESVLLQGKRLSAADVGLLASLGCSNVSVFAPVKVALISTGDELQAPGMPLAHGQFYESNGYTVSAALKRLGIECIQFGIVKDDLAELKKAFTAADDVADVVITSGGVSVGEADYTKTVLDELGKIDFWKVAIKPGKPFAFGFLPNSYFIGLPGNPVSALVTLDKLAIPLLRKISGENPQPVIQLKAKLMEKVKKRPGRMDFQRGIYTTNDQGDLVVTPTGAQGSGILTSMSRANCYIVLAQESGSLDAGETVLIEPFGNIIS